MDASHARASSSSCSTSTGSSVSASGSTASNTKTETKTAADSGSENVVLTNADLELLSRIPPERVIVSDSDVTPEQLFRERELQQERMRAKLTPQQVTLHPNVSVPKPVWTTPQHIIESKRHTADGTFLDVVSGRPFQSVSCYHDNKDIHGYVHFQATAYDTITDRYALDVTLPFCSTACIRTSLHQEQPVKWLERLFWTNELARRMFHERIYDDAPFAPPRAWLKAFCLLETEHNEEAGMDIVGFRGACEVGPQQEEKADTLPPPPQWDIVPVRLCTTMEDKNALSLPTADQEENVGATKGLLYRHATTVDSTMMSSTLSSSGAHTNRPLALCPFRHTQRHVWLTSEQLVQCSRRNGTTARFHHPRTGLPYRGDKCCYHDGDVLEDTLRFVALDYDTITDRFFVDVSVGFCSLACTLATLRMERQERFMDKIHYTQEMTKRVFCEFGPPRFAPPRNCHAVFCAVQGAGRSTKQMRSAVSLKHATEVLHPRLEPIPVRLCTMMDPPKLIQAVGDVGERRPYYTIVSASNKQPPVSVEKPPLSEAQQAAHQANHVKNEEAHRNGVNGTNNNNNGGAGHHQSVQSSLLHRNIVAAFDSVGLKGVQLTPFAQATSPAVVSTGAPAEIVLPSGQIQVVPNMSGLSKSYGML